jgi:hypothetical protein
MIPSLPNLLAFLALLTQLVLPGVGSGVVICVEPGGHVQIEIASGVCCDEPTTIGVAGIREDKTESSDCEACLDLAFTMDPWVPTRSLHVNRDQIVIAATAIPVPHHRTLERILLEEWRPPLRCDVHPHLSHLRSVVIRC